MSGSRWMLCLDASAPRTCVALGRVGDASDELVVVDERQDRANQTSASLDARLRGVLERGGVTAGALGLVACGRGPGTFTGSRVAVATAKGLALGLGLPVVPVSTLAALAASAELDDAVSHAGPVARVLAVLDARREQVYAGVFEVGDAIVRVGEERVIELAAFIAQLDHLEDLLVVGPGCAPYAEQLPPALRARSQPSPGPGATGLWRAAVSALRAGEAVDAGAFSVTYLRESYAEMGINKPKRPRYQADPALYE
jgi:tRNA threonylcarbamoyladenosine biosynthesis protein TsaB